MHCFTVDCEGFVFVIRVCEFSDIINVNVRASDMKGKGKKGLDFTVV